jgi:hypothetical protein
MASLTNTNASQAAEKNIGREFKLINIDGITAASAAAGTAELVADVLALGAVCSITAVGAFTAGTDTEVNVMIEGMDFTAGSGAGDYSDAYVGGTITWLEYLNTLTANTVTEVGF